MEALVIYESMYGNTRDVAEAIADGLSSSMTTTVMEVGTALTTIGDNIDLLVIGGPTHAFGLTRPSTRADAAKETSRPLVSPGIGIREWLEIVTVKEPIPTAAFDTRVNRPRVPGSAAAKAAKQLKHLGLTPIAKPASYYVVGKQGPLVDHELLRAREWGQALARVAQTEHPA